MVTIGDGRIELPDTFYYTKNQHVYVDRQTKRVGLDQIGREFLQNPTELTLLVSDRVKAGQPFVAIITDRGITTLDSPCTGKIKEFNQNALKASMYDTYSQGHFLELEDIEEMGLNLITGSDLEEWGRAESKSLLRNNYSFKIIEIGDSAVGKTAIKVRFTDDYFKKDLKTTLGVDFGSKEIKGAYISNDILFSGTYRFTAKINVWDAAGQDSFDKIRGIYYRESKGAIICYDVNNRESFNNLDKWVAELDDNLGQIPTLLVGNKIDLDRNVSRQEGLDYAMGHGFLFMECSAKTGEKVNEMFDKLVLDIFKREEGLE